VVDLERENGEAVDDEAGSFGMERSFGVLRACEGEEELVHLFDEVVALLVEAVDGVFDLDDARVGDVGAAGDVFFMPEIEVGQVLGADERREIGGGRFGRVVAVPEHVRFVVEAEDRWRVEL
jgi:hypothetical protein